MKEKDENEEEKGKILFRIKGKTVKKRGRKEQQK